LFSHLGLPSSVIFGMLAFVQNYHNQKLEKEASLFMTKENSNTGWGKKQRDTVETLAGKKRNNKKVLKFGRQHLTEGTKERMVRCRRKIWVVADVTIQKKKIVAGESCKCPWCSMCAWVKAKKECQRIATCINYIRREQGKSFLFLTLTAPNVTGDRLKDEITRYNEDFKKLMKRREVERVVKGYIRKLEVTYNKNRYITPEMWYGNKEKHIKAQGYYFQGLGLKVGEPNPNYNTYHPHFHVLIAVNKSYFIGSRDYISKKRWLELWQETMNDKTITQVDAQEVVFRTVEKSDEEHKGAVESAAEIAKYTAKDGDYLHSQEVFDVFYGALSGRQKTTYSGCFAEASKKYKNGELDDYKEKDFTDYVYELFYRWEKDGYLLIDVRELTAEERAAIHGQTVEEMDIED
jgi:plasmid rolling circle replication initiator protein Rep